MSYFDIKNVSKVYANNCTALENINISIEEKDIYGIIGLSGAGKSTLMHILNRLEDASSGKILLNGNDILKYKGNKLRRYRHNIGMIFQHFNLLSSRTVLGNVALPLEVSGIRDKDYIKKRCYELLEVVGIRDKAESYPAMCSGGQKQRIAIARALANNPKILFSDESTSALDPKTTVDILKLLLKLRDEFSLTVIMVTHEMEVIRSICNKVTVLHSGKVVDQGSVSDIFAHSSSNVYTRELLDHSNLRELFGI